MPRTLRHVIDDLILIANAVGLVALAVLWIGSQGAAGSQSFAASASVSGYTALSDGNPPITWPCNAELDVAVNLDRVPEPHRRRVIDDIDVSLAEITAASPHRLTRTRTITKIPTEDSLASIAAATGAALVIAVDDHTRPDATDLLSPDAYGTGGHYYIGPHAYVGWAVLDISAIDELPAGGGPRSLQTLIIHEVLHALGLGHTNEPGSVMQPGLASPTGTLGDADIAGLGRLNLIACSRSL
jgi:hypothetical protein